MDAGERPWGQSASEREPPAPPALQRQPLPRGKGCCSSPCAHPTPLPHCHSLCFTVVSSKAGLAQLQLSKLGRLWEVLDISPHLGLLVIIDSWIFQSHHRRDWNVDLLIRSLPYSSIYNFLFLWVFSHLMALKVPRFFLILIFPTIVN